jgi:hypothetical protein
MVSLPLSARMTDQDVEDVISATTSILEEKRPATSERPADVVSV